MVITNVEAISAAIEEAKKATDKPTLIEIKTTIGYEHLIRVELMEFMEHL